MTRVYNGASFDLMHVGHLFVLRQCRAVAGPDGEVIIGLNTDEFIAEFKGHSPVQSLADRIELVAANRYVDRVVVNTGGKDSRPVLDAVQPDIIAVGHDWYDGAPNADWDAWQTDWEQAWSRYCRQMGFSHDWLNDRGIKLHAMKWLPGYSSTNLRGVVTKMNDIPSGSRTIVAEAVA